MCKKNDIKMPLQQKIDKENFRTIFIEHLDSFEVSGSRSIVVLLLWPKNDAMEAMASET